MALTTETTPTIDGRGSISILFHIPDPDNSDDVQYATLEVQIKRSDGVKVRAFDLLDKLTDDTAGNDTHLPALNSLKSYIIARVNSEMLGL